MIAADVMTSNPRTVTPDATLGEAVEILQSLDVRHVPVVDEDGDLVGMLSDRDVGALLASFTEGQGAEPGSPTSARSRIRVSRVMNADVTYVEEDADVAEVIEEMLENRVGAVPVVDGEGHVSGIISYVDVLRVVRQRT